MVKSHPPFLFLSGVYEAQEKGRSGGRGGVRSANREFRPSARAAHRTGMAQKIP